MNKKAALILVGNEKRHLEYAVIFKDYLTTEVGLDSSSIEIVLCASKSRRGVLRTTRRFFKRLQPEENAIVTYFGHGGSGYLTPGCRPAFFAPIDLDCSNISYDDFARQFVHAGDFFFINESCHSQSAIPAFARLGLLPDRGLIIAAAPEDRTANGGELLEVLLQAYRKKEIFSERHNRFWVNCYIGNFGTIRFRDENGNWCIKIDDLTDEEKAIANQYPKFVYEPVIRCGKTLDHLLFPRE